MVVVEEEVMALGHILHKDEVHYMVQMPCLVPVPGVQGVAVMELVHQTILEVAPMAVLVVLVQIVAQI